MIVPVLNRPERVLPFVTSLFESVEVGRVLPYFVVTEGDAREVEALEDLGLRYFVLEGPRRPGDYARKVNHAIRLTGEPWLFFGADDLHFHKRWLDYALGYAEKYKRRVVGTNDLGNREVIAGRHSTHHLVARSYVEEHGTIDGDGALHEGYDHQFVDNEFVETAMHRHEFVTARASVVEHLHPHWKKAPVDGTYEMALAETHADRALFRKRRRLWVAGRTRRSAARVQR